MLENNPQYIATVFGSTGLVGQQLVKQLEKDKRYQKVYCPNRREVKVEGEKIENSCIDFEELGNHSTLFQVDHIFICLGTTIKKAGSKEKFRAVDYELPLKIAQLANQNRVKQLLLISSLGANANAANFYLKTKGETEIAVQAAFNDQAKIVRPSMLLGDREEYRKGENIGKFMMKLLDFLMVGSLKNYRGIYDVEVAAAMIEIACSNTKQKMFKSVELKEMLNKKDAL